MGTENERKFLTVSDAWRENAKGVLYVQGYLDDVRSVQVKLVGESGFVIVKGLGEKTFEYKIDAADARQALDMPKKVVRARTAGDKGYFTIKSDNKGVSRGEVEFEIPHADAVEMQKTICIDSLVEKTRYKVPVGDFTWEVDEFAGANKGLIVAEVELRTADTKISLPRWIGAEVTDDKRYYNKALSIKPYSKWKPQDSKKCQM